MTPNALPAPETSDVAELAARLERSITDLGEVLVAYSGGVDSSVVLRAATAALGPKAHGVLADTESNTAEDIEIAQTVASQHGMRLSVIKYSELAIENYSENPLNRCFFCKNALYTRLTALARERGIAHVCDGSNADDAGDYRPGLQAVEQHSVRSPLRDLDIGKQTVRALARYYGLPNHERPASPCLSSRVPYGEKITREKLEQIAKGETVLKKLGLLECRCRHHGDVARIEIMDGDLETVLANREAIVEEFRRIGFHWVALDLAEFRSGGLNRVRNNGETEVPRV